MNRWDMEVTEFVRTGSTSLAGPQATGFTKTNIINAQEGAKNGIVRRLHMI